MQRCWLPRLWATSTQRSARRSNASARPRPKRYLPIPIQERASVKVGILGAGQLGRMLALAGYPLGLEFQFLDPTAGSPAGQVGPQTVADYDDRLALGELEACDVVTFEFENVPDQAADRLAANTLVFPPPAAL